MQVFYLKFADEAEAIVQLAQFRGKDLGDNDIWQTGSHAHALDVVGIIHKPTGTTVQTEYGAMPVMIPLPGYHVNMMIDALPDNLALFVVQPATPSRMFAT